MLPQVLRLGPGGKSEGNGIEVHIAVQIIHFQKSQPCLGAARQFHGNILLNGDEFDGPGPAFEPRLRWQVIRQNFLKFKAVAFLQDFRPVMRGGQDGKLDRSVGDWSLDAGELRLDRKPIKRVRAE